MAKVEHRPPATRNEFETLHGVTFCRRCGALIECDARPDVVIVRTTRTAGPCALPGWSWPYPGG